MLWILKRSLIYTYLCNTNNACLINLDNPDKSIRELLIWSKKKKIRELLGCFLITNNNIELQSEVMIFKVKPINMM